MSNMSQANIVSFFFLISRGILALTRLELNPRSSQQGSYPYSPRSWTQLLCFELCRDAARQGNPANHRGKFCSLQKINQACPVGLPIYDLPLQGTSISSSVSKPSTYCFSFDALCTHYQPTNTRISFLLAVNPLFFPKGRAGWTEQTRHLAFHHKPKYQLESLRLAQLQHIPISCKHQPSNIPVRQQLQGHLV